MFKQLDITIPFLEAVTQMPKYAKFLKDLNTKKHIWNDHEIIPLTKTCNLIILRKIPTKLRDSESFTILCTIANSKFTNCLCDLGANINLMPLFAFRRLGLGEVKKTNMSL